MRWLVFICIALLAPVSFAGKGPSKKELRQAKRSFRTGEKHYKVGEFEAAAAAYKEAYRLSEKSALLFNIAQAYRNAGNNKEALYFYRGFLRSNPRARNRKQVERFVAAMEAELEKERLAALEAERQRLEQERQRKADEKRRREAEQERLAAEQQRREIEVARLEEERRSRAGNRGLRIAGLTTGALGLLSIGGGTVFALSARSDWDDINELATSGGRWTPAFQDKYDKAETKEVVSTVMFVAGGAAVITGGVMYFLGRGKGAESSVAIAPMTNGLQVVAQW